LILAVNISFQNGTKYRAVDVLHPTEEVFSWAFKGDKAVIGEYLALIHGIRHLVAAGFNTVEGSIFSNDPNTIRLIKEKQEPKFKVRDSMLQGVIERAYAFLLETDVKCLIMHWDSEYGDNPAGEGKQAFFPTIYAIRDRIKMLKMENF